MQTAKQARHSNFKHGVFACNACSRSTRGNLDSADLNLCEECYELAGIANHLSDTGSLGEYAAAASQYFQALATHMPLEAALAAHPEVAAALADAPAPTLAERAQQAEADLGSIGYNVAVSGSVDGAAYDELILVDAPAARFARRIARAQLREAGIDTSNLVFNARRA